MWNVGMLISFGRYFGGIEFEMIYYGWNQGDGKSTPTMELISIAPTVHVKRKVWTVTNVKLRFGPRR